MLFPFFNKKRAHYEYLKDKWTNKHQTLQEDLWRKHQHVLETFMSKPKRLALGTLAGMVLLTSPGTHVSASVSSHQSVETFRDIDKKTFLLSDLYPVLPHEVRPLTKGEEDEITGIITNATGLHVTAEMQGIRLNRNYGYIGQEQHLMRFPGDNEYTHFDTDKEAAIYGHYGLAPGKGSWGYFARSQESMTPDDSLREKYYIAVPTFLTVGYMDHVKEYSEFFKYRKMLVVNPNNGKAIVADIADSGPSEWTGKHLGGSPEVMHYLERVDGAQKGPVLYFFIEDKANSVPLGPVAL